MNRRPRVRRPSPAMVVALVALFSSLAGGAVAARLVTSKDIKDGSLLAKDFKRGQLGAKMARGGPNNFTSLNSSDPKEVVALTLKAPRKGMVTLSYGATFDNETPGTWVDVYLMERGKRLNGVEWWDPGDADGNYDQTQSHQFVVRARKGRHTYSLRLKMSAGTAGVHDARMSGTFSPSSL